VTVTYIYIYIGLSHRPVRRRVDFKMVTLVYLSLSGMAPPYLAADCQLVSDEGSHQLRSANSRTCVVRRTCSSTLNKTYFPIFYSPTPF